MNGCLGICLLAFFCLLFPPALIIVVPLLILAWMFGLTGGGA